MKCLKCLKKFKYKDDTYKATIANPYLKHLNKWFVCLMCKEMEDEVKRIDAKIYYTQNKVHYRRLHKQYKKILVDSYVANAFVDRTDLKAIDIPKAMIKAKRGFMLMNRLIKENKNGK